MMNELDKAENHLWMRYGAMTKGKTKGNWTVVKESGRTEFYQDTDYFAVIAAVGHQYMRAGSNWDRPNMLLLNGKVVVESGLAELGYRYVQRSRELHEEFMKRLNDGFAPNFEVTQ